MKILALDSSGLVASAAIIAEGVLLAEYTVNYRKTHSQTLLPMSDEIVRMTDFDLTSLDAIAVAAGPGSFTGLRIGSATAKGLGLALDKPLISVPTVDALAYNLYDTRGLIAPLMDARRQQVYTGLYCWEEHAMKVVESQMAVSIQELCEKCNRFELPVTFLGDGVSVYQDQMEKLLTVPCSFAPPHVSRQRAAAVAVLGEVLAEGNCLESAADHKPIYLRMSQAERERAERQGKRTALSGDRVMSADDSFTRAGTGEGTL